MNEKISQWLNFLKVQYSKNTIRMYAYTLQQLADSDPQRKPEDWTTDDLLAYLSQKRDEGWNNSAIKMIVAAFRNFFRYTLGSASPAKAIPFPKSKRKIQRTFDAATVKKILSSCDSSYVGIRDKAMIALMLDTGLRAAEVCNLELDRVDFDTRRLRVIIKGGDEAEAMFSPAASAILKEWLAIRDQIALSDCKNFFVGVGGNKRGTKLTGDGLRRVFTYRAKASGIKRFSPHDLRRTMATLAIRNGAPTRVVQAAGRWSNVEMVERYTAIINAEDFEKYSPVESLIINTRTL